MMKDFTQQNFYCILLNTVQFIGSSNNYLIVKTIGFLMAKKWQ